MSDRPRMLVSACLTGVACRYDGASQAVGGLDALTARYELIPVCPEQLGGLPTPRTPSERRDGGVYTKDGADVTDAFRHGANEAVKIAKLHGAKLALLKARSPSCGFGAIYDGSFTGRTVPGMGVAAEALSSAGVAVYTEEQLPQLIDPQEQIPMIRFNSDYLEGAHPRVMKRLMDTNMAQSPGYGEDDFCAEARETILALCGRPDADIHFLVGGTQVNATLLSAALLPYQGVISADSGHIAVHESGAIEATGHKVLAVPNQNGKLSADQVSELCRAHFSDESHEHMVMPAAVYISNPTEVGTLYSRAELEALRAVCDQWDLTLYMDGARLGYGLMSPENTLDLPFIADTCDAFTIGGTKQGLLFGEALVIRKDAIRRNFRYGMKRMGGMLAKGRLLGVQFQEMLRDGLYFQLSEHAIQQAMRLRDALRAMGVPFLVDSPTNQQFPILPNAVLDALSQAFSYATIQTVDAEHTAVRFCTSWATRPQDVDALVDELGKLLS